jgi:hypothetical protein
MILLTLFGNIDCHDPQDLRDYTAEILTSMGDSWITIPILRIMKTSAR